MLVEYPGGISQRRDPAFMHPATIQMRDAALREFLLGETVFREHPGFGPSDGIYWDNPGGGDFASYDPYSTGVFEKEFKRRFGDRYVGMLREWFDAYYDQRMKSAGFKERYGSPERRRDLFDAYRRALELWYLDPLRFHILHHDRDVLDWWTELWADAMCGYYAWQYKFLQEEVAPKLDRKHFYVAINAKFRDPCQLYRFAWPTGDILGPCEMGYAYSDKIAPGYKLALAASNGKPGSKLVTRSTLELAESLACCGVPVIYREEHDAYRVWLTTNLDLYRNARPGGRIAVLYHLVDGLRHNEMHTIWTVCDHVWRTGAPLEIITERHLSLDVLRQFEAVIVPGFTLKARDVQGLKDYAARGGFVLLIGDNLSADGTYLATGLAGIDARAHGTAAVGEGKVKNMPEQVATAEQVEAGLSKLGACREGARILAPAGENLMLNVLTQPEKGLTGLHLVNYTGKVRRGVRVRLPDDLAGKALAFVSPHGGSGPLEAEDGVVTVDVLDVYGVLVACDSAEVRDEIVARNRREEFVPSPDGSPPAGVMPETVENRIEPGDLKTDERLCRLRQSTPIGIRRIDADIVAPAAGRVGEALPLRMLIHSAGWSSLAEQRNYIDRFAFVMVDKNTGRRERVDIPMPPLTEEEEAAEARRKAEIERLSKRIVSIRRDPDKAAETARLRERRKELRYDTPIIPAATPIRRHSSVAWTPSRPGRYQAYLSFRYVDSIFHGRPGLQEGRIGRREHPVLLGDKLRWDDYMYCRPYLKPVWEEKLPCLIVEVTE